jgi:hypothetical protein
VFCLDRQTLKEKKDLQAFGKRFLASVSVASYQGWVWFWVNKVLTGLTDDGKCHCMCRTVLPRGRTLCSLLGCHDVVVEKYQHLCM